METKLKLYTHPQATIDQGEFREFYARMMADVPEDHAIELFMVMLGLGSGEYRW